MGGITETVTSWIGSGGVYVVFALMLLDAVFPAASEIVMLYAGALAAGAFPENHVELFGWTIDSTVWGYVVMALAGTLGYVVGSVLGWGIGLYGGKPLLERHGRWFHLSPDKVERAERWFERFENWAVFIGRLLPVVRSFISIPAGIVAMPFGRYTLLTFLGTLPWCFGLAGAGLGLGASWERFHEGSRVADYVIVGLVVAGVVYLLVRSHRRRARRKDLESSRRAAQGGTLE